MPLTLDVYTSLISQFLADLAWIACIAYGDDDSSEFLANLTRRIFILKVCFPPNLALDSCMLHIYDDIANSPAPIPNGAFFSSAIRLIL